LKTALKEIATYSGIKCGRDMSTELTFRQCFVVPPPELPQRIIDKNDAAEQRLGRKNTRKKTLMEAKRDAIKAVDVTNRTELQVESLAQLLNDIEDLEDEMSQPFKRVLTGADKLTVDGAYSTYNKRLAGQIKSRGLKTYRVSSEHLCLDIVGIDLQSTPLLTS
jgi:hypothetical protein